MLNALAEIATFKSLHSRPGACGCPGFCLWVFCSIACDGQSCAQPASAAFLQLPATAIEGSSLLFRSLLRDACLEHGPIFDAFLNRLFNTLNWTVTEFVVVLKVLLLLMLFATHLDVLALYALLNHLAPPVSPRQHVVGMTGCTGCHLFKEDKNQRGHTMAIVQPVLNFAAAGSARRGDGAAGG